MVVKHRYHLVSHFYSFGKTFQNFCYVVCMVRNAVNTILSNHVSSLGKTCQTQWLEGEIFLCWYLVAYYYYDQLFLFFPGESWLCTREKPLSWTVMKKRTVLVWLVMSKTLTSASVSAEVCRDQDFHSVTMVGCPRMQIVEKSDEVYQFL